MKKVLQLINSLAVGGAEQIVCNLVQSNDQAHHTVCGLGTSDALAHDIREAGVEVFTCNQRFKFDPLAIYRLYRFTSERDFDILHTHLPYAQIIGRFIAAQTNIDTVVSTQHSVQDLYHPVTRRLERATASMDTATVAVSNGVKSSFLQNEGTGAPRNWQVIHNGIDVTAFHRRVTNARDITNDYDLSRGPVFLNVGRCVPAKAQSVLIEAMAEVVRRTDNPHLLIAGGGPLEEQLREQVSELGIDSHVTLVGHASPIEPYYAAADVFALSSRQEGLPITVLEAMAAETPVVGTKIPGVSELVEEGKTGHLVPPEQPKPLADAMVKTIEGTPKKMGRAGRQRAELEFSVNRMVNRYQSLYDSLLNQN